MGSEQVRLDTMMEASTACGVKTMTGGRITESIACTGNKSLHHGQGHHAAAWRQFSVIELHEVGVMR